MTMQSQSLRNLQAMGFPFMEKMIEAEARGAFKQPGDDDLFACSECEEQRRRSDFSRNQLSKGAARRCKACVDSSTGSRAAPQTRASARSDAAAPSQASAAQRAPLRQVQQSAAARSSLAPSTRRCAGAGCDFLGGKQDFSSAQWNKGIGASRCPRCVKHGNSIVADPESGGATNHLRERQSQRNISDAELQQAKAHGDRRDFEDDGTTHYIYKNVCFVVGSDGAGITAWRLHPAQCICKHKPEQLEKVRQEEKWLEYDCGLGAGDHAVTALSCGIVRARAKELSRETGHRSPIYDIGEYLCCASMRLPQLAVRSLTHSTCCAQR